MEKENKGLLPFEILALELFDAGAIKIETEGRYSFKRHEKEPNASLSPIYFNLRTPDNPKPGPLSDRLIRMIASAMFIKARQEGLVYSVVAGIPNAGDPIAEAFLNMVWVVYRVAWPSLRFEKKETKEGRRITRLAEGTAFYEENLQLLLLDDVIEGAETKLEAAGAAQESGLEVAAVLTLIRYDYKEADPVKRMKEAGLVSHSIFTASELLACLFKNGRINSERYEAGRNFLNSR